MNFKVVKVSKVSPNATDLKQAQLASQGTSMKLQVIVTTTTQRQRLTFKALLYLSFAVHINMGF